MTMHLEVDGRGKLKLKRSINKCETEKGNLEARMAGANNSETRRGITVNEGRQGRRVAD